MYCNAGGFCFTKVGDGNFDPDQIQNYLLLRDNYKEFFKNPPVLKAPKIEFLYLPNGKKPAKEAAEDALKKMKTLAEEDENLSKVLENNDLIIKYLDSDGIIKQL